MTLTRRTRNGNGLLTVLYIEFQPNLVMYVRFRETYRFRKHEIDLHNHCRVTRREKNTSGEIELNKGARTA